MTYLHVSRCGYPVTSTTTYTEAVTMAERVNCPVPEQCAGYEISRRNHEMDYREEDP